MRIGLRHFICRMRVCQIKNSKKEDMHGEGKGGCGSEEWTYIVIIIMKGEFKRVHGEAILLMKQLKKSNDQLNRAIGIDIGSTILLKLHSEQPHIEQDIAKIATLIQQLEQNYLDPDSARKVAMARQQFRIQKDRREKIIYEITSHEIHPNQQEQGQKRHTLNITNEAIMSDIIIPPIKAANGRNGVQSQPIGISGQQIQEHMDYELERKLMHERNSEIAIISKTMLNVQNIIQESSKLTYEQGEQFEAIGEHLFTTYRNTDNAREQLVQASQHHQRAKRKYVYFSLMVLFGIAVALIVLLG